MYLKRLSRSRGGDVWALCLPGAPQPLAEFPELKIKRLDEPLRGMRGDMRVNVLLPYGCVASVSPEGDQLTLFPFDVADAMSQTDAERIVALSVPPTRARLGEELKYQIEALPAGALTHSLDYGPAGMSVTPEGEVTWSVPNDFADEEASVIIAIDTPSGTRDYHSFVVTVSGDG